VKAKETFSSEGYGLTADREDASSGLRMRLDDNEVLCSPSQCAQEHPEVVKDTEWVSADAGVCSGDSGGPALDSAGRVIGVASRGGEDCKATIYGGVEAWSDFIIEIALQAAEVGDYEPPFWTTGSSLAVEGSTDNDEVVVLDEPDGNVSPSGDVECTADCDDSTAQLPRESSCHVSPHQSARSVFWLALTALALALGRRRR
jgi:MYXO-CTERM domain-containing protein